MCTSSEFIRYVDLTDFCQHEMPIFRQSIRISKKLDILMLIDAF